MNPRAKIEPLADPLLSFATLVRRLNSALLLSSLPVFGVSVTLLFVGEPHAVLFFGLAWSLFCIVYAYPVIRVYLSFFPKQDTNVLYLRSFKDDSTTGPIRIAITEALGRTVRVSGIRDPRRRASIFDYFGGIFFLRYANPVYMNLEAGADWRQRLWKTFGQIRLVVIDARDLTRAVIEEVELSARCVGLDRIAFVVDDTKTDEAWKAELVQYVPTSTVDSNLNLIYWRGLENRSTFVQTVTAVFQRVPEAPASLDPSTLPTSTDPIEGKPIQMHSGGFWITMLLVPATTVFLAMLLRQVSPLAGDVIYYSFGIFVNLAFFVFLFNLARNVTRRQLYVSLAKVAGIACWTVFLLANMIIINRSLKATTVRVVSVNNLKILGLAANIYHDSHRELPVSGPYQASSLHRHSWQTKLLPYVSFFGGNYLHDQIDMNQPWNGDANRQLFQTLIPEFLSRGGDRPLTDKAGFGLSHYAGNELVFGMQRALNQSDFTDGLSYTFTAGEAEGDWVAWGDPANIRHPRVGIKQGPHSFGHHQTDLAIMVFADGSVRSLTKNIDPRVFEALGTPQGGEKIDEDDF